MRRPAAPCTHAMYRAGFQAEVGQWGAGAWVLEKGASAQLGVWGGDTGRTGRLNEPDKQQNKTQ